MNQIPPVWDSSNGRLGGSLFCCVQLKSDVDLEIERSGIKIVMVKFVIEEIAIGQQFSQEVQMWVWNCLPVYLSLEKKMATHWSILAWGILWTEEAGGLLSMGSHRVRHDWSDLAAAAAHIWKTLNITHCQENANRNHSEIPPHIYVSSSRRLSPPPHAPRG